MIFRILKIQFRKPKPCIVYNKQRICIELYWFPKWILLLCVKTKYYVLSKQNIEVFSVIYHRVSAMSDLTYSWMDVTCQEKWQCYGLESFQFRGSNLELPNHDIIISFYYITKKAIHLQLYLFTLTFTLYILYTITYFVCIFRCTLVVQFLYFSSWIPYKRCFAVSLLQKIF